MKLKGLHLLFTYRCIMECDHCFVWGSPSSEETMTLKQIGELLHEAEKLSTVEWVWFEGGEPFLYYQIMLKGLSKAADMAFKIGVLSNAYWATCREDALEWLRPLAELGVASLGLSSDAYHGDDVEADRVKNGVEAALKLGIPVDVMATSKLPEKLAGLPGGVGELMYRGRAAEKLVEEASRKAWNEFRECPYEDLVNPKRVHVDPLGYVHVCQGLTIGNAWQSSFSEIIRSYDHSNHPIIQLLVEGGPAALAEKFGVSQQEEYADACHLCYMVRLALREQFPEWLTPDQMYGIQNT